MSYRNENSQLPRTPDSAGDHRHSLRGISVHSLTSFLEGTFRLHCSSLRSGFNGDKGMFATFKSLHEGSVMGASSYIVLGPLPVEGPVGGRRGAVMCFVEHPFNVK
jgi:hypothetical protein